MKEIENTCEACGSHLGWFIGPDDRSDEEMIGTIRAEGGELVPSRCEDCVELAEQ